MEHQPGTDVRAVRLRGEARVVVDGVTARYRKSWDRPPVWTCDEHGRLDGATCTHALRAAAALGEETLGVVATTSGDPETCETPTKKESTT